MSKERTSELMASLTDVGVAAQEAQDCITQTMALAEELGVKQYDEALARAKQRTERVTDFVTEDMRNLASEISLDPEESVLEPPPLRIVIKRLNPDN